MKTVLGTATIPESRLSGQIETDDNAAASSEECGEKLEEESVKKSARESATGFPAPATRGNENRATASDVAASSREVEEQAKESRIDKVAFEDGVSAASATEYIRRGRDQD